jgi:hypothetical protein
MSRVVRHSNDWVRPQATRIKRISTRKKVGPQRRDGSVSDFKWTKIWKHFDKMREMKMTEKKYLRESAQPWSI